jgi:hypothetical protein
MRSKSAYVRLSKKEKEALERIAESWGVPKSDVLRWGLRQVLAGEKSKNRGDHNGPRSE